MKPRRSAAQRTADAYHEAGHVVVAHYLKLPVYGATIEETGNYRGRVTHYNPLARATDADIYELTPKVRYRIERLIMVALAGSIAQRRHRPRSYRHHHASFDHHQAVELASRIYKGSDDEGVTLLLRYLDHYTQELVKVHWPEIRCVAAALLKRKSLGSGDIKKLISDYWNQKLPP